MQMSSFIENLLLNQGKEGLLETCDGTMNIKIVRVDIRKQTIRFLTSEALDKLRWERSQPSFSIDLIRIFEIEEDTSNYRTLNFSDVHSFQPFNERVRVSINKRVA